MKEYIIFLTVIFSEFIGSWCLENVTNHDIYDCREFENKCNSTFDTEYTSVICNGVFLHYASLCHCLPENVTRLTLKKMQKSVLRVCHCTLSQLRTLKIAKNHLHSIPKGCFSSLVSLEELDISGNEALGFEHLYNALYDIDQTNIKRIEANNINQRDVVYPFPHNISQLLTNTTLTELYLDYNEIKDIESGSIYFLPRSLQQLSVKGNRLERSAVLFEIHHLTELNVLDISYQCSTRKYRHGEDKDPGENFVLKFLPVNLKYLISVGTTSGSDFIPKLSLSHKSRLEFIDLSFSGYHFWKGPLEIDPNSNLKTLNLSQNLCKNISDDFFDGFNRLQTLIIRNNALGPHLRSIQGGRVFRGLVSLVHFDIGSNLVTALPADLLKHQTKLERLIISNNDITKWTLKINHMSNLKVIDCSSNKLTTLPKFMRDDLDVISKRQNISLNLLRNNLLCTCENLDFITWFRSTKVHLDSRDEIHCKHPTTRNFTDLYEELLRECHAETKEWMYAIEFVGVLSVLLLIAVICYKKRWAIVYRWYLFRLSRKGYSFIGESVNDFNYDAFLSFAEEDGKFVDRVIHELEENESYQLCNHHRDFTPGVPISKNIVSAVHSSRKMIVFMSHAYLKSVWCRYEMRMAITEEHHMNRRVIIMAVMEDIPKDKLPLDVLHYYKTNCYIELPTNERDMKTYWAALKEALSKE